MARHRLAGVSARAWRAMALVGLALVAVAVVAFAHLHRGPVGTAPARPSAPPAPPDRWGLLLASFGDADHGVVVMSETSRVRDTYVTADAGHTWQPRHVGVSATTFLDPHRAIAVEAAPRPRLESTADAGRSWVQLSTPVRAPALGLLLNRTSGGPTFLDQAHGWWLDAPPGPQPGPIALWRTGDGGPDVASSVRLRAHDGGAARPAGVRRPPEGGGPAQHAERQLALPDDHAGRGRDVAAHRAAGAARRAPVPRRPRDPGDPDTGA